MARTKVNKRNTNGNADYNNALYNRYDLGSFLNGIGSGKGLEGLGLNNLSPGMSNALGVATNAISGAAGNAISDGMTSGAGNIIGGLGKLAGAIPGPWGMVASAGLNLVGGLTNRAFGSKINQQEINSINNNTSALRNFNSNVGSFDALSSVIQSSPIAQSFSKSDVGKDGWFSHKAKNKYNDLLQKQTAAKQWEDSSITNNLSNLQSNQMSNLLTQYAAYGGYLNDLDNIYSKGGDIHINPANKGKFTATKKRTGKSTEELTHSKNPLTRKRAIFAQNAAKWNHAFGGPLFELGGPLDAYGGDFSTGITTIDNGGTHEQNPLHGVPMGTDDSGKPNLVEQGESIWNNYVFSNRIAAPKEVVSLVGVPYKKDMSFSDVVKVLQKPSEERPNDPIQKRGLEANMTRLQQAQEAIRHNENSIKAYGGNLYARGGNTLKPLWNENQINRMFTGLDDNMNYLNPNETLTKDTNNLMSYYGASNPMVAQYFKDTNAVPSYNTKSKPLVNDHTPVASNDPQRDPMTALRFAPAVGSMLGVASDLMGYTNKPDYSSANLLTNAANTIPNVQSSPIGDYLAYTPLDKMYYINQLNANAGAARQNLLNTSGGNRATAMAGLLASDYNTMGQLGNLARQSDEYNQGLRAKVAEFNRGTNQYNSDTAFRTQASNVQNNSMKINALAEAANIRDQQNRLASAGRSANMTNMLNSLGDIGREAFTMDMINRNKALLYNTMGTYKGAKAKGGYLRKKGAK